MKRSLLTCMQTATSQLVCRSISRPMPCSAPQCTAPSKKSSSPASRLSFPSPFSEPPSTFPAPVCNVRFMSLGLHMPACIAYLHVHASHCPQYTQERTFSRIMLQWRSNALTRASSFLLFLQYMEGQWVVALNAKPESFNTAHLHP